MTAFRNHQKSVEKEAGLSYMLEAADSRALIRANQLQVTKERQGQYISYGRASLFLQYPLSC